LPPRNDGNWTPTLADTLVERADELLADLDENDPYQAVLGIEPEPIRRVAKNELADVSRTFGNLVDLKSPWLHGHALEWAISLI
jgi:hypothetical protein